MYSCLYGVCVRVCVCVFMYIGFFNKRRLISRIEVCQYINSSVALSPLCVDVCWLSGGADQLLSNNCEVQAAVPLHLGAEDEVAIMWAVHITVWDQGTYRGDSYHCVTIIVMMMIMMIIIMTIVCFACNTVWSVTGLLPVSYRSVTSLLPVFYRSVTGLLPVCYRSVTGLLPVCYRSVTGLLPVCYRSVTGLLRSVTGLLPVCYLSATGLLPVCYRSVTGLLPVCYRSVTGLLPVCYRSVTGHSEICFCESGRHFVKLISQRIGPWQGFCL